MEAQILTVPNALSGLRLLLVPAIGWLLATGASDRLAVVLLVIAGFTDWLDGYLARRLNQVSQVGVLLDPLADRLAILVFVTALSIRDVVPVAAVVAIFLRDLLLGLTLPSLRARGIWALPVTLIGKCATFGLLSSFPALFIVREVQIWVHTFALAALWVAVLLYWVAGLDYLRKIRGLIKEVPQ